MNEGVSAISRCGGRGKYENDDVDITTNNNDNNIRISVP